MAKILLLLILFPLVIFAQDDSLGKVLYTNDYQFKEGIYISFEQLKLNKPLEKIRIISSEKFSDEDFFEELVKSNKISFYDDYGIKQEVPTSKIWGYCKNNSLFINCKNEFSRLSLVGAVCHFTVTTKVYHPYNDPFYGYNSIAMAPLQTSETREYIFDFKTGSIVDLTVENIEKILQRNDSLYKDFSQLKKRKKRQLMYYYLRKYNEATPLYLSKP